LSPGVILLGSFAKPFHGFHIIPRYAFALTEASTQTALSHGITSFCFGAKISQSPIVGVRLLGVQCLAACHQDQTDTV
jgi:hypothetical protein